MSKTVTVNQETLNDLIKLLNAFYAQLPPPIVEPGVQIQQEASLLQFYTWLVRVKGSAGRDGTKPASNNSGNSNSGRARYD